MVFWSAPSGSLALRSPILIIMNIWFPRGFEIWQYSMGGKVLLLGILALGLLLAFLLRRLEVTPKIALWCSIVLLVTAVLGHILTGWILSIDPTRASGNIPLPKPFAFLAESIAIFLVLIGPLVAAFIAGHSLLRIRDWRKALHSLAFILIAAYAVFITPWIVVVVWD
jgi:hypothetical protein